MPRTEPIPVEPPSEPLLRLRGRPLTGWPATGVSLFCGAVLVLAFAPFDLYLLAPLTLALWFAVLRGAEPRAALRHGYAFGLGFFGFGASWIFNSLLIFGEAPWLLATLITVLFVLSLALYPALLAGAAARLLNRAALLPWLIALAAGFVLMEWLRGWFLSGFPWLLVGHVLLDSPAAHWLVWFGETGAAVLVVLIAVAWVLLLARRVAAGAALLAGLLALSVAMLPLRWIEPAGPALNVGIVQGNIDQEDKWAADGVARALALYTDLSESAAGVDLLVWPETAIPAFHYEVAPELERLSARLEAQGTELVTGIFDYVPSSSGSSGSGPFEAAMHNSVVHVPSGATYDKRQLVPFGEYLPLRRQLTWLDRLLDIPMSDLSPGSRGGPVAMAGQMAGLSVCYESAYARHIRRSLPEASLLINVSNDAWFGATLAPHQHLQIARVRALEMGRPMIRATNTGVSALIAADGRVTARSGLFTREVLQGEILPQQGYTPAARFGPWPALLLATGLLGLALRSRRRA